MSKGLREQILDYMKKKVDQLKEDAQKCAENHFSICCDKIKEGNFEAVGKDRIKMLLLYAELEENDIWKDAYNKKLEELFSTENIRLIEVIAKKNYFANYVIVCLEI